MVSGRRRPRRVSAFDNLINHYGDLCDMNDEIREYLAANRATDSAGEFSDDESLLEAGVIDSMSMVDLITHLEKSYGIVVDEDDMIPENFDSLTAIVDYVTRKRDSLPANS